MQKLAKREEQIMQVFWTLGNAFIKEVIPEMPDPKPHYNSVATMVKILEDKGFLVHETIGNIYRYSPAISKEEYQRHTLGDIVTQYFDNSYSKMLTFFARDEKISEEEVNEILQNIKIGKK